ncbi:MAG: chloride channel protein [Nitrospirota bacterium]|jgi:H+/Cl- antiporter ClcA
MMRHRMLEESVLFISVAKWFFLAGVVGVVVGFSTTVFLKSLAWASAETGRFGYYFLLLPVAMFLSSLMVKYLAPEAEGHGTEKIIDAVHRRGANINPAVVPVKLLATVVTIAFGGSAGKEGPCAQIGAGLSSAISRLLSFDERDRKKLVICGISAGFATVFGTPIAGAIFGVEVLFVGTILYDVLFPSFVAGIVGFQISKALGITYFFSPVTSVPEFTSSFFMTVSLAGVFFGLCSFLLIETMKWSEAFSKNMKLWKPLKGVVGGFPLAILVFVFGTRYLGLGIPTIEQALGGGDVHSYDFIMKIIFTSVTLSFGGSGGIVTPIFFVGATSGSLFGSLVGNPGVFAAIGMVALLAGAANTPISASIMAAEMFGTQVTPYAALACVISFLMTGHRSVYPSQVLAMTKSTSIEAPTGMTMEEIHASVIKPRAKSVTGHIIKGFNRAKRITRRKRRME